MYDSDKNIVNRGKRIQHENKVLINDLVQRPNIKDILESPATFELSFDQVLELVMKDYLK